MGKTSTASKQKYLNKVYTQVAVRLPKELVAQWEEKLNADHIGKAEFFRNAIQRYLGNDTQHLGQRKSPHPKGHRLKNIEECPGKDLTRACKCAIIKSWKGGKPMGRKKKKPKRISEDIKTVVEIIAAITNLILAINTILKG